MIGLHSISEWNAKGNKNRKEVGSDQLKPSNQTPLFLFMSLLIFILFCFKNFGFFPTAGISWMYHCAWSKGVFLSLRTWLQWWHEELNIYLAICFTFAKSKAAWGGNETPKLKIKCAQLWSELITPGQWHIVQPAEMMMQWWHEDLDISLAIYFTFAKSKTAWGGNETAYDKMRPHYGPTPGQ